MRMRFNKGGMSFLMKKITKTILSMILASAMVIAAAVPAWAVPDPDTGPSWDHRSWSPGDS